MNWEEKQRKAAFEEERQSICSWSLNELTTTCEKYCKNGKVQEKSVNAVCLSIIEQFKKNGTITTAQRQTLAGAIAYVTIRE